MLIRLAPGAVVWPAAIIVWGPGFFTSAHRHHCVQLLMAMRGSLLVRAGPKDAWRKCGAALVRPDALHETDARGCPVLLGFVDAESELGAALRDRIDGDIARLPSRQVGRWRAVLGWPLTEARVEQWVNTHLLHRRRPVAIDPRVHRVLEHIRQHLDTPGDLSLKSLAGIAGLSRSRFMHVFTESLGVPLRPYILWRRLQRASSELMDGTSISQAAHRTGFADAAHLTRTFRRMLGSTPSDIALRKGLSRGLSVEASAKPLRLETSQMGASFDSSSSTSVPVAHASLSR
jgi:AraC-like DNA-binding protein